MNKKSSKKPRVLFVTNDLAGYGASLSLMNMYNSIKDLYDCYFAVLGSEIKEDFSDKINIVTKGIEGSLSIPCYHWRHLFTNIWWLLIKPISIILSTIKLCKIIKQYNIDIVHTNVSIIPCGLFAAKICGKKHVWHLREFIYKDQGHYPIIGFCGLRKLIEFSDYVIPISKEIKEFYKTDFTPIKDAVFAIQDIMPNNDIKDEYILFLGSLTVAKQPEQAVEIFAKVSSEFPNLKLKIVGTGNLETKIKSLAVKLNILQKIDFLGYVKNPYSLFNNAKAFLMTSRYEGLGRTTIEAMANDCVVIGYNSGGTADIIQNGKTGFLCNNQQEFINTLKKVLSSDSNCETIRENAKQWAISTCSEENYGRILDKIYLKLVSA